MKFLNLFSPSFTSHLLDPDTISSQSLGSKFCKRPLFSHRLFTYGLYAMMPCILISARMYCSHLHILSADGSSMRLSLVLLTKCDSLGYEVHILSRSWLFLSNNYIHFSNNFTISKFSLLSSYHFTFYFVSGCLHQ